MLLDVPFLPDDDYPAFLAERGDHLAAVHFSLGDPALADARQRLSGPQPAALVKRLDRLGSVPKFVLLNTRLHHPSAYFAPDRLAATADRLQYLKEKTDIQGLIFADPYYLQALSDAHPKVAANLEAQPSINCLPDSAQKVFALLDMLRGTRFKLPSHVVLDRSLNRDPARLSDTVRTVRRHCPDLRIHLMANEGCLPACPYKPAHDGHIAMVVEGMCGDRTFAMNRNFGCLRRFMDSPGLLLASPFIRPEDVHRYAELIDGIKLCGRTKGVPFLKRTVDAYINETYPGNILDLMDAMGDLAHRLSLSGSGLPANFFKQVTDCDKACHACGWCGKQVKRILSRMDPGLERL